jgi:hypothetical protein
MTTFENRPETALLILDVQTSTMRLVHERDTVLANIGKLVTRARQQQVPVVWVQHSDTRLKRGSDDWRIVPELTPDESEPHVDKQWANSFEDTALESVLAELKVGRVIVAGAQTDMCVRATIHGALGRGYDTTLISDAHTTQDNSEYGAPPPDKVIAHTNLYWAYEGAPGRKAGTATTEEVDFGRASLPATGINRIKSRRSRRSRRATVRLPDR